ncbi:hypothetical protein [Paraburkholderia aromaticivorans]|uniref:hypothetical protein n=1 Tax=Paraburkholderia aromaticivorans TaxID=2026199 RepID=UPI0014561DD3|nr:hypothetical protein [Paraburkholderia aromaticivorans]
MKSRLVITVCAIGQRLPLRFPKSLPRLSQTGMALGGAVCMLALSGCYYPYGYYPGGYNPYYATVPAGSTQQAVPVGQDNLTAAQQQQLQQQQQQQAQAGQQIPPPTYAVAAPPVYAPAYPVYYPPPVYPAYYGYPGWYGPSVAIGFGFGGSCCGHGGWGGHGHWH